MYGFFLSFSSVVIGQSRENTTTKYTSLIYKNSSYRTIKGMAKVIYQNDNTIEYYNVQFASDSTRGIINIKNNLGIPFSSIKYTGNIILIEDHINQKVITYDITKQDSIKLPFYDIFSIIDYNVNAKSIRYKYEKDNMLYFTTSDSIDFSVENKTGYIMTVKEPFKNIINNDTLIQWKHIEYSEHAKIQNYVFPRKISYWYHQPQEAWFLLLRKLEVNINIDEQFKKKQP